jgi:hypothetical protein
MVSDLKASFSVLQKCEGGKTIIEKQSSSPEYVGEEDNKLLVSSNI